jgi:autotransporter-associated beta strand protein
VWFALRSIDSHHTIKANGLRATALLVLFSSLTIYSASAVTVRTYGSFDVTFYNNGESYTDNWGTPYTGTKNWTSAEMDDVVAMLQVWDNGIANSAGRQIKLYLMWNSLDGSLGISSNDYIGDNITAYTYSEQVWRVGVNVPNSYADSFIRFDSTSSWNVGAGAPQNNAWDFRSVVLHEIGHSLGFGATTYLSATDKWWSGGLTAWDTHLRDAASGGNQPNVGGYGTPENFIETANPVYFNGVYANAANGGNRAAIYAPSTYVDGASLSHLNESTFPNALMSTSIYNGQMIRQPTPLEWEMMKDMGWLIDTVVKTWSNGAGTLLWGAAGNWTSSGVPTAAHSTYFTNSGITTNDTITLGADHSVDALLFDTTTSFTIGGATGTLTLASGTLSRSKTSSGTQTIARPLALGADAVWYVDGSGQLSITGAISGNYYLEKGGTGTLNLSGANTYTGANRVKNGTLIISGGSTASAAFETVSGTTLTFSGGAHSLTGAAFTNSGTTNFSGGTENLGGASFSNSGTININGAAVTFNASTSIPGTVNFSSGTLSGTSQVTFTGPLTWTNGTMSGSGTTRIQGNTAFSSGGDPLLDGRTLTNSGTATFTSNTYLHGKNGAVINNLAGALMDLQGYNHFVYDGGTWPTLNNAGTFRRSNDANTIYIQFTLNNTGTVDIQSGIVELQAGVTQLVGTTLTGGTWKVKGSSTLKITNPTGVNISTNQANVTLDGSGSTFSEINSLVDNKGSFSIINGRNFTTVGNLANSGTLSVGSGSNFSVSGDLTGTGTTVVNGILTSDSIVQNTLTIGSGSKVVIRSIGDATLSSAENLNSVPEPATLIMLLIAVALAGLGKRGQNNIPVSERC